jgi:SH3 domain protein
VTAFLLKFATCFVVAFWIALGVARAETVYVVDRFSVPLRETPFEGSADVKTIETGTPLELLQRTGDMVRVRDRQGAEGWIETRYVSASLPARTQLGALQAEIAKTRTQMDEALGQLKQAEEALAAEIAKNAELQRALGELGTSGPTAESERQKAAESDSSEATQPIAVRFGISFLWLGIAFAMLILGFIAGVLWLRESIRRRSGGMYLRI